VGLFRLRLILNWVGYIESLIPLGLFECLCFVVRDDIGYEYWCCRFVLVDGGLDNFYSY
jgi:hypothetical protein